MTKIKIYGGHVNTTFQGKGMPKKVSYKCLSLIMKDCVVKSKKKYYPQKLLEECKYEAKQAKMKSLTDNGLGKISSDESDNEVDNDFNDETEYDNEKDHVEPNE